MRKFGTSEDSMLARLDRKPVLQRDELYVGEQALLEEYSKKLAEYRLSPRAFTSIYPQSEIESDLFDLEGIKVREEEPTERGKLLESMIAEQAELSNWFGEESFLIPLSEYDDRVSRGDLVLELPGKNNEIVRILVDITTGVNEQKIGEKLAILAKLISKGRLSNVKYFQSEMDKDSSEKGKKMRLVNIPRVVIGISPESLRQLCREVVAAPKRQENNPVQLMLLEEMESQLLHALESSKALSGENNEVTQRLAGALEAISKLLQEKESLRTPESEAKAMRDRTFLLLSR